MRTVLRLCLHYRMQSHRETYPCFHLCQLQLRLMQVQLQPLLLRRMPVARRSRLVSRSRSQRCRLMLVRLQRCQHPLLCIKSIECVSSFAEYFTLSTTCGCYTYNDLQENMVLRAISVKSLRFYTMGTR